MSNATLINALEALTKVEAEGSYENAGKALDISADQVAKLVETLELQIGVKLVVGQAENSKVVP